MLDPKLRSELVRLAGDPAVTSDRQLAALVRMTLPSLREALASDPALLADVLEADARRTAELVGTALAAEKLTPPQLLALADARYAGMAKGARSLFEDAADPAGETELEDLLAADDPALVELLSRFGYVKAAS